MPEGICPTLQAAMGMAGNCMPFIVETKEMNVKVIGNMDHTLDNTYESANRVYDDEGICPTIPTNAGGDHMPKIIEVKRMICAMRGRNSDSTKKYEQRLEPQTDEMCNTITSVQKDNLVLEQEKIEGKMPKFLDVEKIIVDDMYKNRKERIYTDASPTIRSERSGLKVVETEKIPKIKVAQATEQGYVECEVGGGSRLKLPNKQNTQGQSGKGRSGLPDSDNGEYP